MWVALRTLTLSDIEFQLNLSENVELKLGVNYFLTELKIRIAVLFVRNKNFLFFEGKLKFFLEK